MSYRYCFEWRCFEFDDRAATQLKYLLITFVDAVRKRLQLRRYAVSCDLAQRSDRPNGSAVVQFVETAIVEGSQHAKVKIFILLAMMHGLAGYSLPAACLEPIWASGETRTTAISGSTGTPNHVEILEFDYGKHVGLATILILEKKDRPCKIQLVSKSLGAFSKSAKTIITGCKSLYVDAGMASVGAQPMVFIHGISTCDSKNKKNHRIKGVRVFGAKVWSKERRIEERVSLDINNDRYQSPNCDRDSWTKAKFCDEGWIASGLNVHSKDEAFVGIALRCRKIGWK